MGFLEHIGSANLIITPFILIVLAAVPRLNKKYAPAGRYTLWLLVMLGLMFPFTTLVRSYRPEAPISITVNLPAVSEQPQRQGIHSYTFAEGDMVYAEPPRAESGSIVVPQTPPAFSVQAENTSVPPVMPSGVYQPVATESIPQAAEQFITPDVYARTSRFNFPNISIAAILIGVWTAGAVAFAISQVFSHVIFVRRIKRWQLPVPAEMRALFEEEKAGMGIKGRIRLAYAQGISAPMLAGFVRPTVFLADISYTTEELMLVFRHELTHYRHKDLWYKLALIIVRSLYWYNPAIHLMARQACKDLETLCDYAVTSDMDLDSRKFYSGLILSMASKTVRSPLTSHISGSGMVLKQRLTSILQGNKRSNKKLFVVLGLVLLIAGFSIGVRFAQPHYAYAYTMDADAPTDEQVNEQTQAIPQLVEHRVDNVFLLSVYAGDRDILITQGGDVLTLRYYEWESGHSQFEADNGRVRLDFITPQVDEYYSRPIEIMIPDGMTPGITLNLGEGNLYIRDVYVGAIVVNSVTGDVVIQNTAIRNGSFNLTAGSLEMANTQFDDMSISAPFGNVNICLAENVFSYSIDIASLENATLGGESASSSEFRILQGFPMLRINAYFGSVAIMCPADTVGSGASEACVQAFNTGFQYRAGRNMTGLGHGHISMPFSGVLARNICGRDRDFFGLPSEGVMVAGFTGQTATGLQMRDIIVAIENNPVVTKSDIAGLRAEVEGSVEVTIYRDGVRRDVSANLSWR